MNKKKKSKNLKTHVGIPKSVVYRPGIARYYTLCRPDTGYLWRSIHVTNKLDIHKELHFCKVCQRYAKDITLQEWTEAWVI